MNLFYRIGNAWQAFRSFDAGGFLRAEDVDAEGTGAKLTTPYGQCGWIYIAVSVLAEALAGIPFRISSVPASADRIFAAGRSTPAFRKRVLGENLVESGPAVDLFNQPHPTMDGALFWQMIMSWRALRGEFFIMPLDAADQPVDLSDLKPKVARLLTLPPELFWHRVMGYTLEAWRFTGSPLLTPVASQYLLPSEVVHCRTPNPYLYWRGLSPLTVASLPAATDFAAAQFMKGLMMNNADTGLIVTSDQWPSDAQRDTILAALRARKRRAGTADRPMILGGGLKVEKPTVSSADMQMLENRKLTRQEIGAIYKVPETLMGFTDTKSTGLGSGGSGQEQDRMAFVQNTMASHCAQIEAALRPIIRSFGPNLVGWFDRDSLPVMQQARRDRLDAATKAFAMGIPLNDLNQVYDLGFPDYTWGATGYLPFSLQPAGEAVTPAPDEPENTPDEDDKAANPFARALARLAALGNPQSAIRNPQSLHVCVPVPGFEQSIAGSIKLKRQKLGKFFFQQRGRVLAALEKHYGRSAPVSGAAMSSTAPAAQTRGLDDLFNAAFESNELASKLSPLLTHDLEFGGAQLFSEIDLGSFQLPPAKALAFLAQRRNKITGITETIWNETLKPSLAEGIKAGESQAQLADRVRAVYGGYSADGAEVMRIALTETNTAVQSGRKLGMTQAGVERKGWITSHQENSRDTHVENERITEEDNGIAIDDLWPNGCDHPCDPDGEPGEVINCRCVGIALTDEPDKSHRPCRFLSFEEFTAKSKS